MKERENEKNEDEKIWIVVSDKENPFPNAAQFLKPIQPPNIEI
jgi:hypothetical protein